jgi:hypothetical protein
MVVFFMKHLVNGSKDDVLLWFLIIKTLWNRG